MAKAKRKPDLKIEPIPLADILPYLNNTKQHPEAQVKQIAASIREFGFNDPIAAHEKRTIVEGHGRYLAAQLLGMETVPVICLDHLSPGQRCAYMIAHNKLRLNSEFDLDAFKAEFEALQESAFDMRLTGFEDSEIAEFLGDVDFAPVGENEQGRLDAKAKVICPQCGYEFKPH